MHARWGRRFSSWRVRLFFWYLLLLAVVALASALVLRGVLLYRLDQRIDQGLVLEANELRALSQGNDPETGEPFGGDVERIFGVFLSRHLPQENATIVTFVGGEPFLRSIGEPPHRLDLDADLVAAWATLAEPERGRVDTPVGRVEYLAVPLLTDEEPAGVFVTAVFRDLEGAATDEAIKWTLWTEGSVGLVLAVVLVWLVTARMTAPVRQMTETARAITDTDLSQRIPVSGNDEIAHMAATFNGMLDRLEDAFENQKEFVDDAGHELRTPITIIRGHLELMGEDPEERRQTIEIVMDELDRMSRMVNDLLTLAKAENPNFLDLGVIDAVSFIQKVASKCEGLGHREWRVETRGQGSVVADEQRLGQAIMALADNAVSITAEGDVITLGSSIVGQQARFWVSDNGPGVPQEEQRHIFERFARGVGAKGRPSGAGLGLAIVSAIARSHQGRVELESRPGEGATFTLVIPAHTASLHPERTL